MKLVKFIQQNSTEGQGVNLALFLLDPKQKERFVPLFLFYSSILLFHWAVYYRPKLVQMPLRQLLMLCKFLTERSCS